MKHSAEKTARNIQTCGWSYAESQNTNIRRIPRTGIGLTEINERGQGFCITGKNVNKLASSFYQSCSVFPA